MAAKRKVGIIREYHNWEASAAGDECAITCRDYPITDPLVVTGLSLEHIEALASEEDPSLAPIWLGWEKHGVYLIVFFRGRILGVPREVFDSYESDADLDRAFLALCREHVEILAPIDATARWVKRKVEEAERATAKPPIPSERTSIPDDVRVFVWRRDEGRCTNCGSQNKLEFDHIIPVSMGGSSTARNIQLLCESCNRAKGSNLTVG